MEDSRKAAVDAGRRSLASAQRLFAFPLIILIARGVGTINRIHNWVNPGDDVAALYYLEAIPLASQGWMHAVFCVSGGLLSYIMARCCGGSRAPPTRAAAVEARKADECGSRPSTSTSARWRW